MLARREHSEAELFRKLKRKQFNDLDIQAVIAVLAQEGLLSNARFASNFIHYRRSKGYGPIRIQAELLERGISEDLIEHHLKITDNAWLDDARKVWQKRFKNQLPSDFNMRAKQMRFLQYRGFTREQIDSIFRSDDS